MNEIINFSLTLKGCGLSVDRFVREGTNDFSDSLDFNIPKTYRVVMTRETKMTATSGQTGMPFPGHI